MGDPTPDDAAEILAGLVPVTDRSERMIQTANLSRPLIAWGITWMVGGAAVQLLPTVPGAVIGIVASATAVIITWGIRNRSVRTGRERRIAAGWLALLVSSPLFVLITESSTGAESLVITAAMWALGMLLYGIATPDLQCGIVGGLVIVVAAVGRIVLNDWEVLLVGFVGGLAMLITGLLRRRGPS